MPYLLLSQPLMKRFLFTAVVFLIGACPLIANDHAAEQQLLDSAHKPADLFQSAANPFDLEIDFTVHFSGPATGHLSMKWQSKDHWWRKVEVAGFEQTTISNGEMVYTSRNFPYTPLEVQNLLSLLHFEQGVPYSAEKQRDRTEKGVALTCVQAEQTGNGRETHDFCLSGTTHDLLNDEKEESQDAKTKQVFGDYVDFGGKRYPMKLQLFEGNKEIASASVKSLEAAAFDPALLVPGKDAIERRECLGMKPSGPVREIHPDYFHASKTPGEVSVSVTVLADGSVGDVKITHTGGLNVDKATLAAVKKEKFKPAMCGAEPVVSDLDLSFPFKAD